MSTLSVHNAAQSKQLGLLRTLVDENPGLVNALDADERTPLHWAASSGDIEIVRFLIDRKADIEKADASSWTALHIAVSAGHEDVVQELIGAGADVNRRNDKGITPLHYAASKSRIEIGKLLIARGADINAKDKANQVPLYAVLLAGLAETYESWPSDFLDTVLQLRALSALYASCWNLLQRQTRRALTRQIVQLRGNTPLHLAMDSAHAEAAVVLINAGADRSRVNYDDEIPEVMQGVGGIEQRRARQYVVEHCGKAPE